MLKTNSCNALYTACQTWSWVGESAGQAKAHAFYFTKISPSRYPPKLFTLTPEAPSVLLQKPGINLYIVSGASQTLAHTCISLHIQASTQWTMCCVYTAHCSLSEVQWVLSITMYRLTPCFWSGIYIPDIREVVYSTAKVPAEGGRVNSWGGYPVPMKVTMAFTYL